MATGFKMAEEIRQDFPLKKKKITQAKRREGNTCRFWKIPSYFKKIVKRLLRNENCWGTHEAFYLFANPFFTFSQF